jgi:hypothetical protein
LRSSEKRYTYNRLSGDSAGLVARGGPRARKDPFLAKVKTMSKRIIIVLVAAVALGAGLAWADKDAHPEGIPLLGTIVQWRYPDAKILLDGSTRATGGPAVLGVPSNRFEGVMTTPDPVEKVARFYTEKLAALPVPVPAEPEAKAKDPEPKVVFEQDDSKGRPIQVRVFVVNQRGVATTLVVSRGDGEKVTHIALSQFRWFDDLK